MGFNFRKNNDWSWQAIRDDLQKAGIEKVAMDPFSTLEGITEDGNGTSFRIEFALEDYFLIFMNQQDEKLVNAFSKIFGNIPVISYYNSRSKISHTARDQYTPYAYEWYDIDCKNEIDQRYNQLKRLEKEDREIKDVKLLI